MTMAISGQLAPVLVPAVRAGDDIHDCGDGDGNWSPVGRNCSRKGTAGKHQRGTGDDLGAQRSGFAPS